MALVPQGDFRLGDDLAFDADLQTGRILAVPAAGGIDNQPTDQTVTRRLARFERCLVKTDNDRFVLRRVYKTGGLEKTIKGL